MKLMPLAKAKAHLSQVAHEVEKTHERVHITRNGRQHVVLIAQEDLDSLEATIELLSDPAAMARVQQAEADLAAGAGVDLSEMEKFMQQRRSSASS